MLNRKSVHSWAGGGTRRGAAGPGSFGVGDMGVSRRVPTGRGLPSPGVAALRRPAGGRALGAGGGVGAHPGDYDPPQGVIGLAVAAGAGAVAGALAGGSGDRGSSAQM